MGKSISKEDGLLNKSKFAEQAFIIYNGGCPPRAGRSRKVPLQAKNVETISVAFPVARSRIKATKKEMYATCGESSTYSGRYSGVEFRSSSQLPLIEKGDKKNIINSVPETPEDWVEKHGTAIPLFWAESKPIGLWGALLDEFKVRACFDLTPGSGALMEAALVRGIVYHALCQVLS